MPNKLCSKCVQNTEQCYSHRETYKRQERVLYDMIKKPTIVRIFYILKCYKKKNNQYILFKKIGGSKEFTKF